MKTIVYPQTASYSVELPGGCGGHQFLTNMENPGKWEGGGVLSEIPSVVGYGYFLEPHISRSNLQASETECCCKSVLDIEKPDLAKTT